MLDEPTRTTTATTADTTSTLPDADRSLGALMHEHASQRDRPTFALQILDGTLMASLAMFSHSKPWMFIALTGAGIAMHGLWSMADMRIAETTDNAPILAGLGWHVARGVAAIGGVLAAFALLLSLFGVTLGTWIS